jgi:hypothetical protein
VLFLFRRLTANFDTNINVCNKLEYQRMILSG